MRRLLFKVFGRHVVWLFGAVSALAVAVLTALYLTGAYVVESYTSDQIGRLPWDTVITQNELVGNFPQVHRHLASIKGVKNTETLAILRLQNGLGARVAINGKPIALRWLTIIGVSNRDLLPPDLANTPPRCTSSGGNGAALGTCAFAAIVSPRGADANLLDIHMGSRLQLKKIPQPTHAHIESNDDHNHPAPPSDAWVMLDPRSPDVLFDATIGNVPTQIDRQQFNNEMLRRLGSLTYLPELSLILVVPMPDVDRAAVRFDQTFIAAGGLHGGEAAPPYVPEVNHLLRFDHDRLIAPFDLRRSIAQIAPVNSAALATARSATAYVAIRSDIATVLKRMEEIARLIGVIAILTAIPLLWLSWTVAAMLSDLLLLNERRRIGLASLRGIDLKLIVRTLSEALLLSGIGGSLAGLVLGIILPVAGYAVIGIAPPPAAILMRGLIYFSAYILFGTALALVAGRRIKWRIMDASPKEIAARADLGKLAPSTRRVLMFDLLFGLLVILGLAELLLLFTQPPVGKTGSAGLFDALRSFIAVPLLLFGLSGLLRNYPRLLRGALSWATRPLSGKGTHWFLSQRIGSSRHRITSLIFVSALATALVVLPLVAADSFDARVKRGVRIAVGGDTQVDFDMAEMVRSDRSMPVGAYERMAAPLLTVIKSRIAHEMPSVRVSMLDQYVLPGIYIPDQPGLTLTVVEDPAAYLRTVDFEEALGITRPFSKVVEALDRTMAVSTGLLAARDIRPRQPIVVGARPDGTPIRAWFTDIAAFLPGQSSADVENHKGLAAAEIDYANAMLASDARAIAGRRLLEQGAYKDMPVVPMRVTMLVRTGAPITAATRSALDRALAGLPFQARNIRWVDGEQARADKDMFVSLALANLKVFFIAGLLLAIVGIAAMSIVNFISERRTFGLVRLRGASPAQLVRMMLAYCLAPVGTGIVLGTALGIIAGYGFALAIWDMPRVTGVAGLLPHRLVVTASTIGLSAAFSLILVTVTLVLAIWPFRRGVSRHIRES